MSEFILRLLNDRDALQVLIVLSILLIISLGMVMSQLYRLGQTHGFRRCLRTHFSATLQADRTIRQRL